MEELERFIAFWLGPHRAEYGISEDLLSTLALPEPLRRLYAFAGNWPSLTGRDDLSANQGSVSIFSTQDVLLQPCRLQWTDDGKVVFIHENQGVWSLATQTAGEDAPVWIDSEELGIEKCDKWPEANDSLARLLTTFCFQELTFGAKFGVWDTELTKLVRSGQASLTPLWLKGSYVWPDCFYSFYLMEGDVLVGDYSGIGTDDSYFFGANSESGINRIRENESPVVMIILSTPNDWRLEVREDGSGTVGIFARSECKAEFVSGTFDFASLRDNLLACQTDGGDYRTAPVVYFMRSGRGYADGKGVTDLELVDRALTKAIGAAVSKESLFDVACRDIPFGEK